MESQSQEYYKTRLEHTITYTQQATRLIYLVNGAVVAFLYFVIKDAESLPNKNSIVIFVLFLLALINGLHTLLIISQRRWYSTIDEHYAASVRATVIMKKGRLSTHILYGLIHFVIVIALILAAVYLFLYPIV